MARQASFELVDPTRLRVCADPNNLPFSNDRGEGFENEIADLLADRLGVSVSYTWYPDTMGFVRNTLRAGLCDVIMGVVAGDELVQNTNPYYRTSYVLAHRAGEGDGLADLASPAMTQARIGVIAGTPPANLLARHGLLANVEPYQLRVDTRLYHPAQQMMEDLASGKIDVALVWGPIGGYYAEQLDTPVTLVPLSDEPGSRLRLDFRVSMGIRPGEPDWKHRLNGLIRELQPEIDAILRDYGVPLLDVGGRLTVAALTGVPEPEGYRMEKFRAPVPATLQGATVLDADGVAELMDTGAVVIDVLPKQIKPAGRDPNALWLEPARADIPGSLWLPNVGLGELPPDLAQWFAAELERLTGGDPAKPLVFYCDSNCWMSYNAAKRAMREHGYTNVHWFPGGVQAWKASGRELAEAVQAPTLMDAGQ